MKKSLVVSIKSYDFEYSVLARNDKKIEYRLDYRSGLFLSDREKIRCGFEDIKKTHVCERIFDFDIINSGEANFDFIYTINELYKESRFINFNIESQIIDKNIIGVLYEGDSNSSYHILREAEKGNYIIPIINAFENDVKYSLFNTMKESYLLSKLNTIIKEKGFKGGLTLPAYCSDFGFLNRRHDIEFDYRATIGIASTMMTRHLSDVGQIIKEIHICFTKDSYNGKLEKIIKHMNKIYKASTNTLIDLDPDKYSNYKVPKLKFPLKNVTENNVGLSLYDYSPDGIYTNYQFPYFESYIITNKLTKETGLLIIERHHNEIIEENGNGSDERNHNLDKKIEHLMNGDSTLYIPMEKII